MLEDAVARIEKYKEAIKNLEIVSCITIVFISETTLFL